MRSIKSRLTLVSMVVLVVFMVLTAIALERAVVKRARQAEENGLQLLIYSLLAAVDQTPEGHSITVSRNRLFEPSLVTRSSGLYAHIYDQDKREIWRSESVALGFPPIPGQLETSRWEFDIVEHVATPYFRLGLGIVWPDVDNQLRSYDVVVWRNAVDYFEQLTRFRQTLWAWLIITTTLLLVVMYLVMRWSLRPLQLVGREIKAIEDQQQSGFEQRYPDEIAPLTENLNILLKREQFQRQRYRIAMDDLAHSLKTPLAVLTGLGEQAELDAPRVDTLREQTERMNQIVSYQLQKATSESGLRISRPVDLARIVTKLVSALEKVYREKGMRVEVELAERMPLRMDEGDCLEVIGNLLDNAFKYGRQCVRITGELADEQNMRLSIEDDGGGLGAGEIKRILQRGTRLDEATEGQGIGLAVVADIVESYDIELEFGSSTLGGLSAQLVFRTA
ncbi:MAG: ATP-binding protein [Gammaproteobacteria bacterium]|nr:ATP-binding protein [Gammaproteobacteria bacterium]